MIDFIRPYFGEFFTLFIGYFLAWFFFRRKQKAEVTTTEIDNGDKVIKRYKDALDDLESRYDKKVKYLEEMCNNLEKLFERKEKVLLEEIEYHKKQAALYKKMLQDKIKEFNSYKKDHPAK